MYYHCHILSSAIPPIAKSYVQHGADAPRGNSEMGSFESSVRRASQFQYLRFFQSFAKWLRWCCGQAPLLTVVEKALGHRHSSSANKPHSSHQRCSALCHPSASPNFFFPLYPNFLILLSRKPSAVRLWQDKHSPTQCSHYFSLISSANGLFSINTI